MTALQEQLRQYRTLSEHVAATRRGQPFFDAGPHPVLLWQDWKKMEDSNEYRTLAETVVDVPRMTLYLPRQAACSAVVPLVYDGDQFTIGRAKDNDLQLRLGNVSTHHAHVAFDGTGAVLTDLGSTNGTWHRAVPLKDSSRRLESGDHVGFGAEANRFQYLSANDLAELLEDLAAGNPYMRA